MVHIVIYVMRGWIAFVAFIEFSNAIRCFTSDTQFLNKIYLQPDTLSPVTVRLFGRYFLLNGIIMTHCALFIHHLPIISVSIFTLALIILLHLSETLYYFTSVFNFYVIFPTLLSMSTIICLFIAPLFLEVHKEDIKVRYSDDDDDEEEEFDDYQVRRKVNRVRNPIGKLTIGKLKTN